MDDMEALTAELEHYKTEKEKIRDIVGKIGGQAHPRRAKLINVGFLILVTSAFAFEVLRFILNWHVGYLPSVLVVEVAVLLVSLKIIWMIHTQTKVDHFQFWILHSIEFQMNMLSRRINELSAALKQMDIAMRQHRQDNA
jgi:hypothetical protein